MKTIVFGLGLILSILLTNVTATPDWTKCKGYMKDCDKKVFGKTARKTNGLCGECYYNEKNGIIPELPKKKEKQVVLDGRCYGTTKKNERCKNKTKTKFCKIHEEKKK